MGAFEGIVFVRAQPEQVFALYADAASWAKWDPDIEEATRDGPFVAGATGTIKPKEGPKTKIRVTKVEPNRAFDAEARLPLCTMRFEHLLEPMGAETKVTHRVVFTGPLAFLFRRIIGRQLRYGIPRTMGGLKKAVEGGLARG